MRREGRDPERSRDDKREKQAVEEPVGGQPQHAERRGDEGIEGYHHGHRRCEEVKPAAPCRIVVRRSCREPCRELRQGENDDEGTAHLPEQAEERGIAPGERKGHAEVREERKQPQRAQTEGKGSHHARLLHALPPIPGAEPRADGEQSQPGWSMRGMEQDDGGEQRRGEERGARQSLTPAHEREGHEGKQTPSEPRRDQPPAQAFLDPAA